MTPVRLAAIAAAALVLGAGLVVLGVALVYPPAGVVLAGLALGGGAVFLLTRDIAARGRR